ncbi:class I SAM-dependent methyltransferase [Crocinitomix catalasitica]|uniref:class I SAM-dependent methyltransferase n=1 Tax=Crocinitomix catalasitica TaxID=184607 RepID=UPI00056BF286|nr:class I SAM-dependent methyltransferase [Crocinitomix catalasitica]
MARIFTSNWKDYELIDAGNDLKLERWGKIITIRPDRNAYFTPQLSMGEWKEKAHFEFKEITRNKGEWKVLKNDVPQEWQLSFKSLVFNIKLTQFKHVGLFPEQAVNWEFIQDNLKPEGRFLNLFGYTGGASIAARAVGADVFHCDSVKQINAWAKENMESSNLNDIHWVHDDALKFAQRELKRGNKYDGIIMDPPAFGLGAKKERWKIEDKFAELLETTMGLLSNDGFLIANTYSPRLKAKQINEIAKQYTGGKRKVEVNVLANKTTSGKFIEYGDLTRIY